MSKISLGQLDLTALQKYFEIVAGFRKKDDKAIDVQYVGEYLHPTTDDRDAATENEYSKVEANQVAMAALDEYGMPISYEDENGVITIPERQTVKNALMLGGIPAEEYLQTVRADTILTDVNQATYNMADDIRNLKDELYQLKNQLVKTGAIKDSNVYNGFIDSFIADHQKHIISTGVKVESVSGNSIFVESVADLKIGDYIVLEEGEKENKKYNIQVISEIIGLKEIKVDYEKSIGDIGANAGSMIQKSLGIGANGKFVFGHKPESGYIDGKDTRFIVKDGISRIKVFELDHAKHGFGTEIKIPASLENNTISAVEFSLAVKGDPGSVRGVFWKYDEAAATYTKTDYRTESVSPLEASGWFNNFNRKLTTEMPVVPGEKYLLILETEAGDANNKWYIGGFAEEDCLDDVHNDCYIQSKGFLYISAEDTDMFLVLDAKEKREAAIKRTHMGLYTCHFDVYQSAATRLRVEMCINQEGLFKVKDNNARNLARGRQTEVPIEPKGVKIFRDKVFESGDHLVIGTQLGTVASCGSSNNNVVPKEDMYIAHNADVYRVGYKMQAIVSNKEFDPTVTGVIERYKDAEHYDLELVGVIPGRDIIRPEQSSDRLIFECDLYNQNDLDDMKLKQFNHVELQILWQAADEIDDNVLANNEELEGAIFDLSISVDQAYTRDPRGGLA